MNDKFQPTSADCILYGYRGSIAHNLYVPPEDEMGTDDEDFMGVCIAPLDCYVGLNHFEGRSYWDKDNDIIIYDLRKFVRLLVKSNPNVLGFLWNHEEMWINYNSLGSLLIEKRKLFASKLAYNSFVGYAHSQLKKMEHCAHKGYMGAKRKALVDKFGYDSKNASHLIRLLKMGVEFLNTGKMNVYRVNDREELLDIKKGKWSLEKVKEEASKLFVLAKKAKDNSPLPDKPDLEKINNLLVSMYGMHFSVGYLHPPYIIRPITGETRTMPYTNSIKCKGL